MIVVVSAGANDQSNRTPREVFEPVLGEPIDRARRRDARRSARAAGSATCEGRRNFTSDRAAEAALGLQELLQGLVDQHARRLRSRFSRRAATTPRSSALQRRLAAEVVVEYAGSAGFGRSPADRHARTRRRGAGDRPRAGAARAVTAPSAARGAIAALAIVALAARGGSSGARRATRPRTVPRLQRAARSPSTRSAPIGSARSAASRHLTPTLDRLAERRRCA